MKLDIQCARTHWIRGYMTFQPTRRTQPVMLVVPELARKPTRETR
jgi:hypothetical protein